MDAAAEMARKAKFNPKEVDKSRLGLNAFADINADSMPREAQSDKILAEQLEKIAEQSPELLETLADLPDKPFDALNAEVARAGLVLGDIAYAEEARTMQLLAQLESDSDDSSIKTACQELVKLIKAGL
jgi:hypothetical protein